MFLGVELDGIVIAVAGVGHPLPVLEDVEQTQPQEQQNQDGLAAEVAEDVHDPVGDDDKRRRAVDVVGDRLPTHPFVVEVVEALNHVPGEAAENSENDC